MCACRLQRESERKGRTDGSGGSAETLRSGLERDAVGPLAT